VETLGGVARTRQYEYDELGRLTEVRQDSEVTGQCDYDRNANRTATISGPAVYDGQDRIQSHAGLIYQIDADDRVWQFRPARPGQP
jgi:YD repeat-containing protein